MPYVEPGRTYSKHCLSLYDHLETVCIAKWNEYFESNNHLLLLCSSGKLTHYTLPPESGAPIAEPVRPAIIALEEADFPLQELDEIVYKRKF